MITPREFMTDFDERITEVMNPNETFWIIRQIVEELVANLVEVENEL